MKPEIWLALYAATTSTIAIAIQMRNWLVDRARVTVNADKQFVLGDKGKTSEFLIVTTVNHGRRPVWVKRVAMYLKEWSPDSIELTIIYEGDGQEPVELPPDGAQKKWELRLGAKSALKIHTRKDEDYGSGFVSLTSGREIPFEFLIPK